MGRLLFPCLAATLLAVAALTVHPASVAGQPADKPAPAKPSRQELDGARHRLEKLEQKVRLARGQPIRLDHDGKEALTMIKRLKETWPDDPDVEALYQRARVAFMASEGAVVEITPDMLSYRENERKLQAIFVEEARKAWDALRAEIAESGSLVEKPFPAPSHRDPKAGLEGKYVVLEDFEYPTNEFSDLGRQFCFVGSGTKGYYFVNLAGRNWIGAYEAVKRYRRFINQDVPEGMKWTLVGVVTGVDLLIPEAGKQKFRPAQWGWVVEPHAILVPDRTLAIADPLRETGGFFAGEPRMEEIKSTMYTVREIPPDVTPERLTEIFATAIKEKNYELYLDCILPRYRQTPRALSRCMYHWEWHQRRFATFYCHVIVDPAKVTLLKGYDAENEVKDFFRDDEHRTRMKRASGPMVEMAELRTRAFTERGLQYGSPKPFFLRREGEGRWYMDSYAQPF